MQAMKQRAVEHVGVGILLRARRVTRVRAQGGETRAMHVSSSSEDMRVSSSSEEGAQGGKTRAQGGQTRTVLRVEEREREREEALEPILNCPLCS